MKSWILLFVFNVAAIGVLGFDQMEAVQSCIRETNIGAQTTPDGKVALPMNDPAIKCFMACLGKKAGWMTKNGEIIRDKLLPRPISEFPEEIRPQVEKLINMCVAAGETGKDKCEKGYLVMNCMQSFMKKRQ